MNRLAAGLLEESRFGTQIVERFRLIQAPNKAGFISIKVQRK